MCCSSKLEHIAHYKAKSKNTVKTNILERASARTHAYSDGPFSSLKGRSSNASSFYASLHQLSIGGVVSLALCPHVAPCLKILNTLDVPKRKSLVQAHTQSFPFV